MKPSKVREAAAVLKRRKLKKPSPKQLAKAAEQLVLPLDATLAFIMRLKQGAQNQQAQRRELLLKAAESGQ